MFPHLWARAKSSRVINSTRKPFNVTPRQGPYSRPVVDSFIVFIHSLFVFSQQKVLELSPGNKNALVERSACYLKIGKNELALADAEESLKENKEFTKGLYEKAEALYAMGEFELALVFYHRGKKLRGDVKEFQLGINKAQEAIDNCVGGKLFSTF